MDDRELLATLLRNVRDAQGGFLTDREITQLAQLDRLRQVLIRCGCGRMVVAAQDVAHFAGIIDRDGTDYVRDVALLAGDPAYQGDYRKLTNDPAPAIAAPLASCGKTARTERPDPQHEDYGGAFDGWSVTSDADPGL